MLFLAFWLWFLKRIFRRRDRHRVAGRRFLPASLPALRARKPGWVIEEIVRLKALMSEAGCRRIADTFNRLHASRHRTTVSKTWVATTMHKKRLEIEERRREWKRRIPRPIGANLVWGLDLTGKADSEGAVHPILGIADHSSRFSVALRALADRSTLTILRSLLDAVERHGKPRALRTDNEATFTSPLFGFALAVLGIRHQRTELHCPWMNGRVERFFGTLKEKLDRWEVDGLDQLALALGDFRTWYNHVRPHQHLGGRTPFEAWQAIDPYAAPPRDVRYFSAWDGMLTGYWLRK